MVVKSGLLPARASITQEFYDQGTFALPSELPLMVSCIRPNRCPSSKRWTTSGRCAHRIRVCVCGYNNVWYCLVLDRHELLPSDFAVGLGESASRKSMAGACSWAPRCHRVRDPVWGLGCFSFIFPTRLVPRLASSPTQDFFFSVIAGEMKMDLALFVQVVPPERSKPQLRVRTVSLHPNLDFQDS